MFNFYTHASANQKAAIFSSISQMAAFIYRVVVDAFGFAFCFSHENYFRLMIQRA